MSDIGWYISNVHIDRAVRYFYSRLQEDDHLASTMDSKLFFEMWQEAMRETAVGDEPSPLGPDPEEARKFLLTTIEGRLSQVEDRSDRMENALSYLNGWLHTTLTRYGHKEEQELERILYGETGEKNERDQLGSR